MFLKFFFTEKLFIKLFNFRYNLGLFYKENEKYGAKPYLILYPIKNLHYFVEKKQINKKYKCQIFDEYKYGIIVYLDADGI